MQKKYNSATKGATSHHGSQPKNTIGISGSGNSENVLRALRYANENDGITVGLTGFDGGKLKDIAHLCLIVPVHYMQKIEDIHMLVDHLVTSLIREEEMAKRA